MTLPRTLSRLSLPLLLAACTQVSAPSEDISLAMMVDSDTDDTSDIDHDLDGYCAADACSDGSQPGDCDDTDPAINPAAIEVCDGVDDDCDGVTYTVAASASPGTAINNNRALVETIEITDDIPIVDLDIEVSLTHSLFFETSATLTSPAGTQITLWNGVFTFNNSYTLLFDDEAGSNFGDIDGSGTYRPGGSLSDFDGESALGTWTLTISDSFPGDNGTLVDWTLDIDGTALDGDADGAWSCEDCDDDDASTYPGAPESVDGIDSDCDGLDFDGDADGEDVSTDCDDADPTRYTGAPELCDDLDNDCDGALGDDELDGDADGLTACAGDCDPTDPTVTDVCPDRDGDGYALDVDCDDDNGAVNPGQVNDLCNGIDEDCDDEVDEDCDGLLFSYAGSGYFVEDVALGWDASRELCQSLGGELASLSTEDENDHVAALAIAETNESVWIGFSDEAEEGTWVWLDGSPVVDTNWNSGEPNNSSNEDCGVLRDSSAYNWNDNDCSGSRPALCEFACDVSWYADADGDGEGAGLAVGTGCGTPPEGFAANGDDCDDADASLYAAIIEVCDGVATSCTGILTTSFTATGGDLTDADTTTFELDVPDVATASDLTLAWTTDHAATGELSFTLTSPAGTTAVIGASGDTTTAFAGEALLGAWMLSVTDNAAGNTGALTDWTLDIVLDENDADADGFAACEDCNDSDPTVFPGATETLDGVDSDCDGLDLDADGDGFDASVDCDDSDDTIFPGATEATDGIDSDCDGLDRDDDGDGVDVSIDCDDNDDTVSPLLAACSGEVDSDCDAVCDSADLCEGDDNSGDIDGDGYCAADVLGDEVDCDDDEVLANPGSTEVCGDGIDNDCDGVVSQTPYGETYAGADIEDTSTTTVTLEMTEQFEVHDLDVGLQFTHTWASDLTVTLISPAGTAVVLVDGHGDDSSDVSAILDDESTEALSDSAVDGTFQPDESLSAFDGEYAQGTWTLEVYDGYSADQGTVDGLELIFERDYDDDSDEVYCDDCNDLNRYISPDETELDAEGIDQDCDGFDLDADGDGWESVVDCDDNDAAVNPGAAGCVDDVDSDCDGVCDAVDLCEGDDASGDADADGHCATAFDGSEADCDDASATVYPGAVETCDGVDVNCVEDDAPLSVTLIPADGTIQPAYDGGTFTLDVTEVATIANLTVGIDLDVDSTTLLGITLTSPAGTTIELMDYNAINRTLVGDEQWIDTVTFDDDAIRSIDDLNLPIAGSAFPADALALFDGESTIGTWTLYISPLLAEEDGTLHSWTLDFTAAETDGDADSFLACEDCDDAEATTNPIADEDFTDAIDNDCDGFDLDADNDGYNVFDDCDDNDPDVNPAAEESCWDGVDTDCDGTLPFDEYDLDGDGYTECGGDCGPEDDETYPGAEELCDDIDNDCDGELGEDELDGDSDGVTYCDGDCVGDDAAWLDICPDEDGDGELADTDCDDRNAAVNSSASGDTCNGFDDDCDGELDEDCACTFFEANGRSYTYCEDTLTFDEAEAACEADGGTLGIFETEESYDAMMSAIYSFSDGSPVESWMGLTDRDTENTFVWLDGTSFDWWFRGNTGDDDLDCATANGFGHNEESCDDLFGRICQFECGSWYLDADGDGYGTGAAVYSGCGLPPTAYASVDGDCDDSDAAVNPSLSSDCDTFDLDGDGYCVSATCVDGSLTGDCDDTDATRYAGAVELCDGLDNDCDGTTPDGEPDDADADGVCDIDDLCDGDDAWGDSDVDGVCDDTDPCPLDSPDDADADGQCDSDATDTCFGYESAGDSDSDGVCDELDLCEGDDAFGDTDADGICDDQDTCEGNDLSGDLDADGVCNDVDACPFDAADDSDADGSCDSQDLCQGDDSSGDSDGDGICDDQSLCEGDESLGDSDGDGLCDVLLEVTPGQTTTFDINGARADSRVYILYSTLGEGGNFCHPTIDVCADLRQPTIGPSARVGADGTAQVTLTLGGPPTSTLYYRAVWVDTTAMEGETSNMVSIPPPN